MTPPRLGVVLKVNGESTFKRQKLPDVLCTPWVFETDLKEFGIRGFQMDSQTLFPFVVASQQESKAQEVDYGEFVGTISITVFGEQRIEPKTVVDLSKEGEDFAILANGTLPEETPENFNALQAQLRPELKRGLFSGGKVAERHSIQTVSFKGDSIPLLTATIRYYTPQDLPR